MKKYMQRIWSEDDGVLSFEWVLLVTLLTIGIVVDYTTDDTDHRQNHRNFQAE